MSNDELVKNKKKIIIIGAGSAGREVARRMIYKHYKKYDIICFIDDDKSKFKAKIHGIPVLGNVNDIIKFNNFDEIFICCPEGQSLR